MKREELLKTAKEKLTELNDDSINHFIKCPIKAIYDYNMLNEFYNEYGITEGLWELRQMLNKFIDK